MGSGSGGWWGGGGLPVRHEGNREGLRVGWGQAKEPESQCERVCRNYPLSKLPFSIPRMEHSCKMMRPGFNQGFFSKILSRGVSSFRGPHGFLGILEVIAFQLKPGFFQNFIAWFCWFP